MFPTPILRVIVAAEVMLLAGAISILTAGVAKAEPSCKNTKCGISLTVCDLQSHTYCAFTQLPSTPCITYECSGGEE